MGRQRNPQHMNRYIAAKSMVSYEVAALPTAIGPLDKMFFRFVGEIEKKKPNISLKC